MRSRPLLTVACATLVAITVGAQGLQPVKTPWRGAGQAPCVGGDGGFYQCAAPAGAVAVRAGRLFDSRAGLMRTRQIVVVHGDRIAAIGSEGQVTIPAGAQVIDLSGA